MRDKTLIFLFIAVIILWILCPIVIRLIYPGMQERGQAGDLFGAVNSLFSGLAFAGIIWSLRLQQTQLEMQKEELKLQREEQIASRIELKGQKEQLQEQSKIFELQRFENSFFAMLDLYRENKKLFTGNNSFEELYAKLKMNYKFYSPDDLTLKIQFVYDYFFLENKLLLSQYFKNLYLILEFIKKSNVSKKIFYSEILATQLSAHEKLLIFYHCLSQEEINKFKPLVEEFSLLKNISSIELIDENNHYPLFEKTVYSTIG